MNQDRNRTSKTLTRTFLALALAAGGVQAIALIADGDFAGTSTAEGWDAAGVARLNAMDLWPQLGALIGAGGRSVTTSFQLPNIWDTTSAFIPAESRGVTRVAGVATGTLEPRPEPPGLPPRAADFAPPITPAPLATTGVATLPSPGEGPVAVLLDDDGTPDPAPVPLPATLWLLGSALLPLLGRGRASQ